MVDIVKMAEKEWLKDGLDGERSVCMHINDEASEKIN
jgi:hypothetical protein